MIAGIVLAAGTSSRMGPQKLLLPMRDGRPLVRVTVERVLEAPVDDVVVVLGREAAAVGAALSGLPVRLALNPRYEEGQSTSLRAGLDALVASTDAFLVVLADQPLPGPTEPSGQPALPTLPTLDVVGRLIEAFHRTGRPIVVPRYEDGRGHPVLFAMSLIAELRAVAGDQGGRSVIARDPSRVAEVPVAAPMPRDVDTWADYQAVRGA